MVDTHCLCVSQGKACRHRFANMTFVPPGETDNTGSLHSGSLGWLELAREKGIRGPGDGAEFKTGPPLAVSNKLESP